MKQILLAIDDETARQLDAVAPARSRRRSEFVRMAIRKTLWELQERQTAEAYARMPDGEPFVNKESGYLRFYSEVASDLKLNMRFKISDMMLDGKLEY